MNFPPIIKRNFGLDFGGHYNLNFGFGKVT